MTRSPTLSLRLWLIGLVFALGAGAASGAALRPQPEETWEPEAPQILALSQTDMTQFDPRSIR